MLPRLAPALALLALAAPAVAGGCDAAGPAPRAINRARPAESRSQPAAQASGGPAIAASGPALTSQPPAALPTGLYVGRGGAVVAATGGPPPEVTIIDFHGHARADR